MFSVSNPFTAHQHITGHLVPWKLDKN